MKNERLMAMIDCLLRDGRYTAEALASRFEVSVRTIYRDIDSLSMAGIPVVAESGSGGGYSIDPAYRVDRSFLSRDELADLSALLRGMPEALKDGHIERSLGKISSLGPRGQETQEAGTQLPPALVATLSPWGAPGPNPESVISLRRAIADNAVVSFEYVDGEGRGSRRSVEPFTLVMGGAVWYLHAFCRLRSEWRLFKLSRIRSLQTGLERFDPYARLPAPHPFQNWNESLITVSLAIEPRLASVVEDVMPGSAAGSFDDGSTLFVFQYPDGEWLVKFLLSFGPGMRILGPERLKSAFAAAAREMADANTDTI